MSVRCLLGRHDWQEILREHDKPVRRQLRILVVPSLFSGPPFLAPTGIFYYEKHQLLGRICRRCGTQRSA